MIVLNTYEAKCWLNASKTKWKLGSKVLWMMTPGLARIRWLAMILDTSNQSFHENRTFVSGLLVVSYKFLSHIHSYISGF